MFRGSKLFMLFTFCAACAVGAPDDAAQADGGARVPPPTYQPGQPDTGSSNDAGVDASACPASVCSEGEIRCRGSEVQQCEPGALNSCLVWGSPRRCPGEETCIEGVCTLPTGCVDNDGDGHGPMCAAGTDCNDAEAAAFDGAAELCDGVDNNCDGTTDEGFDVGAACTSGSGNCQGTGIYECAPDGTVVCSGVAVGLPEMCDGIDNDCNGAIDDGVCTMCSTDIFEPNNAAADATMVQANSPQWGFVCPGDTDWFELETQTGVQYHIYVTFPEDQSDLLVRGWVDGVNVVTGDTTGRDYEVFVVNGDAAKTFQIEVVDRDNTESFFRIALVADLACSADDGFSANQSIQTAAFLPAFWRTGAYMCSGGLSDWYALGDLSVGETVDLDLAGENFGTDLDLHLWGDPDGNNVFERMATSATFDNIENISFLIPTAGAYYVEVIDFDGYGGPYDIEWSFQ